MRLDPKTINKKVTSYIKLLDPGVFNLSEIKTVRLNSLITGYQNVNFFLELNGLPDKKFVIRFHPDNKNGADKTAVEAQNMVLLRDRGIPVPRVVYVGGPTFVNSSVIIMEFIDSKNIDFKDLSPPQIKSLGETVAKMHAIRSSTYSQTMGGPPDTTGDYEDYLQAMTEYSIDRYLGPLESESYHGAAGLIEQARQRIARDAKQSPQLFKSNGFSLLHTDLGEGNVLWSGNKLTLIDWEEVTFGDPADEVSYIFMVNNLPEIYQTAFLKAYFTLRDDASLTQRIAVYTIKNRLFDFVWSIYQLHHFGHGKASEVSRKSMEVYERNYMIRREALEKTLLTPNEHTLPDSN